MTPAAGESGATRLVRAMLAATAALIAVETGFGVAGRLTVGVVLGAIAALIAFVVAWRLRSTIPPAEPAAPWTPIDAGLVAAIAAALLLRLFAGMARTTFLYDTLSYHLHAPLSWMHAGRLHIVPSPFGDPAPAYAPANLELVFLALMAPLRSDALAGVGQLPFAALAATAIAAAVREGGGRRPAALAAALALLLVPEVWTQIPTAMTDLGLSAFLLASVPFTIRLGRTGAVRDALPDGIALGLAIGTKYVGALVALPFLTAAVVPLARRRGTTPTVALLVPIAAIGGFWYLRNLIATGNPFYPVATLGFAGLYDRAAMRAWDYHVPIGNVGELGEMLAASGIGFASAAGVALIRGWREPETWLAFAGTSLFWLVVPYQESRFLFPVFGVAAIAIGRQADRGPPAVGWGGLAVALVGALLAWPTRDHLLLVPAALAGALGQLGWRRLPALARTLVATTGAAALVVAIGAGVARFQARDPGYAVGDGLDEAWRWFRANVRGRRVAYTGTNLAFPLAGDRLSNRVDYVNVAGAPTDRLHDFGRRAPGLREGAEPAPYRDGADAATWLANLRTARAEVLFVAALYPIVRRSVVSDAEGFPIERMWADAHPERFRPRYVSPAARVYEVLP